jgi:hypothetical protein
MERDEIERFLSDFDASSAEVMDRLPAKRATGAPGRRPSPFAGESVVTGDYVLQRDGVRSQLTTDDGGGGVITVADLAAGKAPIEAHDHAADLVDALRYQKPEDIHAAGLGSASLPVTPWSDDYWGIYKGVIACRYADPGFPASDNWKENHDYVVGHPASKLIAAGAPASIDLLSPAEKYDLLVGDAAGKLTAAMWDEGWELYDRTGTVETWMGICHGWAPAAYMFPRPRRVVTARTPSGLAVRFFPSDIKALGSLLWANSSPKVRLIGTRCSEKDPQKDENGRVLDAAAFDTNPGTWHLAVVNQIGAARRALVMDATYDYEVWNQPVMGYEIHYFNPQTMAFAATPREATVARGDFGRDRFARYRSADYTAALGVAMRTRYVAETAPSHAPSDDPSHDHIVLVDYYYDLELDDQGTILGGEWYLNRHPDFLWTPSVGQRSDTPGDAFASGTWDGTEPLPESWRAAAVRASAEGLPLAKIVEQLFALAS